MRGKGVRTRLLLTVLCAQVCQRGYEEVQSESERRHGIFSKRKYDFRSFCFSDYDITSQGLHLLTVSRSSFKTFVPL